jgi:hypothetical protein
MYNSGYITSSVAPAPNYIINYLEPDMITAGWVKSSTNVATNVGNAGSTLIFNVYRSPNTLNSLGKDFYLAIGWDNATNANLAITTFEQFDPSTNACLGYPPLQGRVTREIVGANLYCNTSSSGLPNTPSVNGNCGYFITSTADNLSTVSFKYYHSVTIDRVITCSSNTGSLSSGHAFYGGLYDSFIIPTLDPYPICIVNFLSTAGTAGVSSGTLSTLFGLTTREPAAFTKGAQAQGQNFSMSFGGPLNFMGTPSTGVLDAYANRVLLSKIVMVGRTTSQGGTDALRGLLKDVYASQSSYVPSYRGDTIETSIAGTKYTATCIRATSLGVTTFYPFFLQV